MGSVPQVSTLRGPVVQHGKVKLHQLFSANASKDPEATALIYEDLKGVVTKFSFIEVEERSNRLARALVKITKNKLPNGDGDRIVGLCLEPSASVIISILAIWKAGCSYLPFAPSAPVNRTKHIVNEAQPILVITDKENVGELYAPVQSVTFAELEVIAKAESSKVLDEDESYQTASDAIVMVLYTSGSTGLSKGVRVRNSSTISRLQWQWREMSFGTHENNSVFKTSLTFVDSVSELWAPLLEPTRGRTLVIVPSVVTTNPQSLVALLHKYKIERLLLVPSLLKSILLYLDLAKDNARLLDSIKSWVCSGETLSVQLSLKFFETFPSGVQRLYNYYGSTEVMGDVTYYSMGRAEDVSVNGKVPIGIPLDNTIIYLLNPEMRLVNVGQMGEMYVAGSHLAHGYVNKRDAFRFIDNPHTVDPEYKTLYKTGDYARIEKGILVFEGRTDSQIKVRGNRVDLSEIEAALNKETGIQKGVVLCHNSNESDQQIVGFVLPEPGVTIEQSEIEKNLLNSLADYAIPQVVIINKMPYLINGKVDRQHLLEYYKQLGKNENASSEGEQYDLTGVPNNKEEEAKCLFRTVGDVLGKSIRGKVNNEANFYNLGGNSLNSVITISKLKEQGFLISITDFITADNLGVILKKMCRADGCGSEKLYQNGNPLLNKYKLRFLEERDKEVVFKIIVDSFHYKSQIEPKMDPPVERSEYEALLEAIWPYLVKHQVSIVAMNDDNEIMGANLGFQIDDEPDDIDLKCQLQYVLELLDYLEIPIRESMIPKEKVIHAFMLGTDQRLSPQENVEITEFLEVNLTKFAKEKGFVGTLTTNTSPLTQQLAVVHDFQPLKTYQLNQYVASDGTRPFKNCEDDVFAIVSWKPL